MSLGSRTVFLRRKTTSNRRRTHTMLFASRANGKAKLGLLTTHSSAASPCDTSPPCPGHPPSAGLQPEREEEEAQPEEGRSPVAHRPASPPGLLPFRVATMSSSPSMRRSPRSRYKTTARAVTVEGHDRRRRTSTADGGEARGDVVLHFVVEALPLLPLLVVEVRRLKSSPPPLNRSLPPPNRASALLNRGHRRRIEARHH
jgi:hypothetical protein